MNDYEMLRLSDSLLEEVKVLESRISEVNREQRLKDLVLAAHGLRIMVQVERRSSYLQTMREERQTLRKNSSPRKRKAPAL